MQEIKKGWIVKYDQFTREGFFNIKGMVIEVGGVKEVHMLNFSTMELEPFLEQLVQVVYAHPITKERKTRWIEHNKCTIWTKLHTFEITDL